MYLYSCVGSGGTLDYIVKVASFFPLSLCELSSRKETGNTTILILLMLKKKTE